METIQLTLNSRLTPVIDTQKRSIMQVSLNKDVIVVDPEYDCYASVQSAEILNNIRAVDSTTVQNVFISTTNVINRSPLTVAISNIATTGLAVPINTPIFVGMSIKFTGVSSNGVSINTNYFIKTITVGSPTRFTIATTLTGVAITLTANAAPNLTLLSNPYFVAGSLQVPPNGYTNTTLATAINGKTISYYGTLCTISCTVSAIGLLTLTASAGFFLYFQGDVPIIGMNTKNPDQLLIGNSIPMLQMPFLQNKHLFISTDLLTTRSPTLCKIPVNAAFGSYILYSPSNPLKVKIHNDLINTFTISLLDESYTPVHNNYADFSLTIQFDFVKKEKSHILEDFGSALA